MKSSIVFTLAVSAALFSGCQHHSDSVSGAPLAASENASPNDAIRTAIQAHLSHNGNLSLKSFDTEVKQVTFDGDHAQAQVEFHVKNGTGTMQLTYALEKRDGVWSVSKSTPGGSNFSHPALEKSNAPAGSGTTGGDSSVFHVMDNLHQRTPAKSRNLLPEHPSVVAPSKNTSSQMP
jgi:hypothetical protein